MFARQEGSGAEAGAIPISILRHTREQGRTLCSMRLSSTPPIMEHSDDEIPFARRAREAGRRFLSGKKDGEFSSSKSFFFLSSLALSLLFLLLSLRVFFSSPSSTVVSPSLSLSLSLSLFEASLFLLLFEPPSLSLSSNGFSLSLPLRRLSFPLCEASPSFFLPVFPSSSLLSFSFSSCKNSLSSCFDTNAEMFCWV